MHSGHKPGTRKEGADEDGTKDIASVRERKTQKASYGEGVHKTNPPPAYPASFSAPQRFSFCQSQKAK